MPHTTTKGQRGKRPDTRPNEKQRRKMSRKIEEDKAIQEIRVTKKQKTERVEREVTPLPLKKDPNTQTDKVLRALRKRLRQIEELMKKQENGDTLDAQQLQKIETLDSVLEELASYTERKDGGREEGL